MVNYQLGKIYKIVDNTNGNIYVGSTCESTLARRLANHVSDYKRYLKSNENYMTSFSILKNNDYEIILIEAFACYSKDELHARERHFIETLKCVNKLLPIRLLEEEEKDDDEDDANAECETISDEINKERKLNYHKLINLRKRFEKYDCEISREFKSVIEKYLVLEKEKSKQKDEKRRLIYQHSVVKCDYCEKQMKKASIYQHMKMNHSDVADK